MDSGDHFDPEAPVIDLHAKNRWEAIDELIAHLVATQKIRPEHRAEITASVCKREASMTTGIGFGIGLPHASTPRVSELVAVVGRSRKGMQFDALDKRLVTRVVLFLVPQGRFQEHLHTFASFAKMLHRRGFGGEGRRG